MIHQSYQLKKILPALVQHNMKHAGQFKDYALGNPIPINNPQDMQNHVVATLFNLGTKSFSGADNRDFFYHSASNTLIIINSGKDQNGNIYGGSAFRPDRKGGYFEDLYQYEAQRLGREPLLQRQGGIMALRPEVAREFAKGISATNGKRCIHGAKRQSPTTWSRQACNCWRQGSN